MTANLDLQYQLLEQLFYIQTPDVQRHALNVANLSSALAQSLGCSSSEVRKIFTGALLHDIGKCFISQGVLNKTGKLTKKEYEDVMKHPWAGYTYLLRFVTDSMILDAVVYHHEKWNGTGYPYGLSNREIPIAARICTVADVWDALISDRCYRNAWNKNQAMELISAGAGSLFDPEIVFQFLHLVETGSNFLTSTQCLHLRKETHGMRIVVEKPSSAPETNGFYSQGTTQTTYSHNNHKPSLGLSNQ